MNDRQARFVEEYLIDLNATQAAIRAGYAAATAGQKGHDLLKKVEISEAIQEAMRQRSERTRVTADRVLEELARIGFSDALNHYEVDELGRLVVAGGAPDGASRAVASVKRKVRTFTDKDGESEVTVETEFRLWDKNTALANIGKHLGMFVEKLEHSGPGGGAIPTEIVVTRRVVDGGSAGA